MILLERIYVNVDRNNTKRVISRLFHVSKINYVDEVPYYLGRHIIGRDTKIDGGVYLGSGAREAIVVDFENSPELQNIYRRTVKRLTTVDGFQKDKVITVVYDSVLEAMPPTHDKNAVDKLIDRLDIENGTNLHEDGKISLNRFIEAGVSECRHYALTAGVILEKLKENGHINGTVSVDRNSADYYCGGVLDGGGHAWVRYTNSIGKIYIIDVAKTFKGPMNDGLQKDRWPYEREKDFN